MISVTNELLPDFVDDNFDTSTFEVWTYRSGWQIVPYQIDEINDFLRRVKDHAFTAQNCNNITPPADIDGPCEFEYALTGSGPPTGKLSALDELVFLAGATGQCDVSTATWPGDASEFDSTRYRLSISDHSPATLAGETGCVYLFRRIGGMRPTVDDLISYDAIGDGTSHTGGCLPTAAACGAIVSNGIDVDLDQVADVPPWQWDFLGNWAVNKWFIGESTTYSPLQHPAISQNMTDLIKWRITSPAETEGVWDGRAGVLVGCRIFYGYIDGPVRVVRKIGGAASGVRTTRYDYAYPGEVTTVVNLRVHDVNGTIYSYPDLLETDVSAQSPAKVYKAGFTGTTAFDDVDGSPTANPFSYLDWYQVSSQVGSFLRLEGEHRLPTTKPSGLTGAYSDQETPLWSDTANAREYDVDEIGDRAAARSEITDTCDTQNFQDCRADRSLPGATIDPKLDHVESTYVMLSASEAGSNAGATIATARGRGVLGVSAAKEVRFEPLPGPPVLCLPTMSTSYGGDGGPVTVGASVPGCTNLAGWSLYAGAGVGSYRRLGSLPIGSTFQDAALALNEQRIYYASAIGKNGAEGSLSQGLVFQYTDSLAPEAPSGLTASATAGQITLSWTPPTAVDVERTRIYAGPSSSGPFNLVDAGGNSHCQNTRTVPASAGTYYVIVKAVDFAGNTSATSNVVQVVVP